MRRLRAIPWARQRGCLLVKDAHYEGASTERVVAPPTLGRMGRRLRELAALPVARPPLDLYATLAETER